MINIKDAEILDLLPFTFKTDEYKALSKAIASLTAEFYRLITTTIFWTDIKNATEPLLDAMAGELQSPFYAVDMTIEQKRRVIEAAFKYNSKLGTVSAVKELLAAAFGAGDVQEWYEYGGKDFYFKLEIGSETETPLTPQGYDLFRKNIEVVKPLRAKLEKTTFYRDIENNLYVTAAYVPTYKRFTIKAAELPPGRSGTNG